MATDHHTPMSPVTRRQLIDYIVYERLGRNCPVWFGEERTSPVAIAYRSWAIGVTPSMRASLETMTRDALQAAHGRCNDYPGWLNVHLWLNELQEQQEEAERRRQYRRDFSKRGGEAKGQPADIIAAIQHMYADKARIYAKTAHDMLTKGYAMPDGTVVNFKKPVTLKSFQRWHWPKRKTRR